MKHKNIIIIVALLVFVVVVFFALLPFWKQFHEESPVILEEQQTTTASYVDIALDFYNPWLVAAKSTSTDPYKEGLVQNPLLSRTLRDSLAATEGRSESDIDPVLCQTTKPEKVTARIVSETAESVRVLVMAKEKELTAQSVFTLVSQNGGWFIDSILCAQGEFDVPREFTFDKEGYLLKESIPAPYNNDTWHLVFEDNGEKGHVVPLYFAVDTSCIKIDGVVASCVPDQFTQATKVHIYGNMTEQGVEVKKMEFLN
jgi:hypothetical protein